MKPATVPLWENLIACAQIFCECTGVPEDIVVSNPSTQDGGSFTLMRSKHFYVSVYPDGVLRFESGQWAKESDGRGLLYNLGYQVGV